MVRCLILLFIIGNVACSHSSLNKDNLSPSVYNLSLASVHGDSVPLTKIKEGTASVFFFISPECPVCQHYSLTINEMIKRYNAKGIAFYGIFPGIYYSHSQIEQYLTEYNMFFIPLTDPSLVFTNNIHASVTPEAFVVAASGTIVYHGCIDNRYVSAGKPRSVITEHYLDDVLQSVINNRPITVENTTAIGCYIE